VADQPHSHAPRSFSVLRDEVMADPERAANVERIKEEVMAEQRPWCIVPTCDEDVRSHQRVTLEAEGGGTATVMVPFCKGHGLKVGGSV
jgi:hypothetical protein